MCVSRLSSLRFHSVTVKAIHLPSGDHCGALTSTNASASSTVRRFSSRARVNAHAATHSTTTSAARFNMVGLLNNYYVWLRQTGARQTLRCSADRKVFPVLQCKLKRLREMMRESYTLSRAVFQA